MYNFNELSIRVRYTPMVSIVKTKALQSETRRKDRFPTSCTRVCIIHTVYRDIPISIQLDSSHYISEIPLYYVCRYYSFAILFLKQIMSNWSELFKIQRAKARRMIAKRRVPRLSRRIQSQILFSKTILFMAPRANIILREIIRLVAFEIVGRKPRKHFIRVFLYEPTTLFPSLLTLKIQINIMIYV